jgi:hypothetical protein
MTHGSLVDLQSRGDLGDSAELLGQARHPQNAIARDRRRSNVHTWIQVPRALFGATVNVAWDSERRLPQRRSACMILGVRPGALRPRPPRRTGYVEFHITGSERAGGCDSPRLLAPVRSSPHPPPPGWDRQPLRLSPELRTPPGQEPSNARRGGDRPRAQAWNYALNSHQSISNPVVLSWCATSRRTGERESAPRRPSWGPASRSERAAGGPSGCASRRPGVRSRRACRRKRGSHGGVQNRAIV